MEILLSVVSSPALEFKSKTEGRRVAEKALQTAWEVSVLWRLIALGPLSIFLKEKKKRPNQTKQHQKLKPPSRKKNSLGFNDFANFVGYCSISGCNWTGVLRWPILPTHFIHIMKCVALMAFSDRIRMLSSHARGWDWLRSRPFVGISYFRSPFCSKENSAGAPKFSLKVMSQQPGRGAPGACRLYFWRFIALVSLLLFCGVPLCHCHFIYHTPV